MMGLSGIVIGLSMLLFVKNPERAKTVIKPVEESDTNSSEKPTESKNVLK